MIKNLVEWDKKIVYFLYQSFYDIPFIQEVLWFLSSIEVYLLAILLWYYFLWALMRKDTKLLQFLFFSGMTIVIAFFLAQLLSSLFPFRSRPFVFLEILPIIPHIDNTSFPSSHAIFFGVSIVVMMRWFFPLYQKIILIFLGGLMCLSRVIGAIHYPSDIFVWTIIWLFFGFVVFHVISRIFPKFSTPNHP